MLLILYTIFFLNIFFLIFIFYNEIQQENKSPFTKPFTIHSQPISLFLSPLSQLKVANTNQNNK